jgi:arylsulfatase A-like enzyme
MHRGFRLHDPRKHLAAFLQEQRFETALCGIQHISPGSELTVYANRFKGVQPTTQQGQIDWPAHDRSVAESAAGFLEGAGKTKPFFLDCGFWLPHRPFPEPEIEPRFPPSPGVADTPETRKDMAGFLTAVRHMDRCCGIVLDALAESGHADDTLVVFTTDHGPAFPGYKCNLSAKGTGVALILRVPGNAGVARSTDALVSQVDLFPTLCEFLGLRKPGWTHGGISFRPVIDGKVEQVRQAIFSEVTYHAGYEAMRGIRTETHSLIRVFDDDLSPVPANVDDSPAKDALIESGWLDRPREAVQLYDLKSDPDETRNVANDPAFAELRAEMLGRLERWMEVTSDPLLEGWVPLPPGGYANDRAHLSPTMGEL